MKFLTICTIVFLIGCTTINNSNGYDPRPPLMDDSSFVDFEPAEV